MTALQALLFIVGIIIGFPLGLLLGAVVTSLYEMYRGWPFVAPWGKQWYDARQARLERRR